MQRRYGIRFDWGPTGATRLAADDACVVIVDVLSFSTSVTVALEAGTRVFPYHWRDASALTFAELNRAELAVGRRAGTAASPWTLSPAALRRAPVTPRLVLPSPNGSSIAASVAAAGSEVLTGCLRNATATADWLVHHRFGTPERPAIVIAAGERRRDGTLRPALEDLLGAGAIIAALRARDASVLSPEAAAARASYEATTDVAAAIAACESGVELSVAGFADDVAIAVEIDACALVAHLVDGAFTAAR